MARYIKLSKEVIYKICHDKYILRIDKRLIFNYKWFMYKMNLNNFLN